MKRSILIALVVIGSVLGPQNVLALQGPNPSGNTVLGEGEVAVAYGRPSTRGRDIMSLMRPGSYWRLGADNDTMLKTQTPLRFGDATLPAGSYILLAHLMENDNWQLVVCTSGTSDFAPQDTVATVPLTFEEDRPHVEQLTLDLERDGEQSMLVITWGPYRLAARFSTAD